MHPAIESFMERPLSHKVGVAVVSFLIIGFVFWQYLYSPVSTQAAELTERKGKLSTDIISERRIARDLPKFQERVKELEAKLKQALQELPDEKDIPNLLKSVADLARDSGLEVSLFKPEGESRRDFFFEVPVTLTVEGSFRQVATFIDEVGRMPRIVNIKSIVMKEPRMTDKYMNIKSDCVAVTYRYIPEEQRKATEGEDKKRRRK